MNCRKILKLSHSDGLSTIRRLSLNMYPLFLRNNKVLRIVRAAFLPTLLENFVKSHIFFRVEIRVGNHILPTLMLFELSNRLSARKCTRARFDRISFWWIICIFRQFHEKFDIVLQIIHPLNFNVH